MTTRQLTPARAPATLPTPDPLAAAGTSDVPVDPAPSSAGPSASNAEGERDSDDSIAALVARLIDQADRYARAELRFARALLIERLIAARVGAICLVVALVLLQGALIALLVGLMLTAAPVMGTLAATVVVTSGAISVAGILGWIALRQFNQATRVEERP
ncbi:MAG: phage holin family protein [Sphingomonas sp.]|uniref:phage holin family protein n=1 Tax=Sphingomonas sp. TaxID=28214 RepID=UPI000DB1F4C8|nr:hypothetical protein [Parvibaculum sp.]MBA4772122.1 phage holin family protein [Sphingomonas sp.]PZP11400.1 MAG: hypothetical protein DI607_10740 [Sphingomonas hengshuiensis]